MRQLSGGVGQGKPARLTADQPSIASVTPTLCALLGVPVPSTCQARPLAELAGRRVQRCLVYCPDAIGKVAVQRLANDFQRVRECAPFAIELRSPLPPVTPVCFATMFTGSGPDTHGIRKYEKPVVRQPTLFDALAAAGRRVAIVAVADSSVDTIFRERPIDYWSEPYDADVTTKTNELLSSDGADVIVVYHQEYDDVMHKTAPYSDSAVAALRRHVSSFVLLVEAANEAWSAHDRAVVFAPDHGVHLDGETGHGTHGSDLPDDVEVVHFYGFAAARTV